MKRFLLFLSLATTVNAATVVGKLSDISGNLSPFTPKFEAYKTPYIEGTNVIVEGTRFAQVLDDYFTIEVKGGIYNIYYSATNAPIVGYVPISTNIFQFSQIATNIPTFYATNFPPFEGDITGDVNATVITNASDYYGYGDLLVDGQGRFDTLTNKLGGFGVDPFGGIWGDGAHITNSPGTLISTDFNIPNDGVTDAAPALQNMFDTAKALGMRDIYIAQGSYALYTNIYLLDYKGLNVFGASMYQTVLKGMSAYPCIVGKGVWFSTFSNLRFEQIDTHTNTVFKLEGEYPTYNCQGNSFRSIVFDCHYLVDYAFKINDHNMDNTMGSENTFYDCHFLAARTAGLAVYGYNALNNTLVACQVGQCTNYGIYVDGGSVDALRVNMQNTYYNNYDVKLVNGAAYPSSFMNCRSESLRALDAGNQHVNIYNWTVTPGVPHWATNTSYNVGELIEKMGNVKDYIWRCTTAGTSGTNEPAWTNNPVTDGTVVWTRCDDTLFTLNRGGKIDSCQIFYGKIFALETVVMSGCRFSRPDYLAQYSRPVELGNWVWDNESEIQTITQKSDLVVYNVTNRYNLGWGPDSRFVAEKGSITNLNSSYIGIKTNTSPYFFDILFTENNPYGINAARVITSGTNATAEWRIENDQEHFARFMAMGSAYPNYKIFNPGDMGISIHNSSNFNIFNDWSFGSIRLAAGGNSTPAMTIDRDNVVNTTTIKNSGGVLANQFVATNGYGLANGTNVIDANGNLLTLTTNAAISNAVIQTDGTSRYWTTNPVVGGRVTVGFGSVENSSDPQFISRRVVDDSKSGNGHCFSDSADITRGGIIGYNSFDARVDFLGTNNYDHYAAFQALPSFATAGVIDKMYGLYSGATVTAGSLSKFYGAYIATPTGTVSNSYPFVSEFGAGNIGFGVIAPTSSLHIVTSQGPVITLENSTLSLAAGNVLGGIAFVSRDSSPSATYTSAGTRAKVVAVVEGASGETGLAFSTMGATNGGIGIDNSVEALRISKLRYVGIGTTNPTERLVVVGNMIVSNSITGSNIVAGAFTNNLGGGISSSGDLYGVNLVVQTNINFPNRINKIGTGAGQFAVGCADSHFNGYFSGQYATNCPYSHFDGYSSGQYATNCYGSHFGGYVSGRYATNCQYSLFDGYYSGQYTTNCGYSLFDGYASGRYATDSPYSIFLGANSGTNVNRASTLLIHSAAANVGTNALVYGEFDNRFVRINGRLQVTNELTLLKPAWRDVVKDPQSFNVDGTAIDMVPLYPGSPIMVHGWNINTVGYVKVQLNHDLAVTNSVFSNLYIEPHIHISVTNITAALTNVTFKIDYVWTKINDVWTAGVSGSLTNTIDVTPFKHHIMSLGSITNNAASGSISSIIEFKVTRINITPGDVAGEKVRVHDFDVHYPVMRLGSSQPSSY